jgi:hypothetical protein
VEKGARGAVLIKVDVQGAELQVLAGRSGTLGETEPVILEVTLFGTMIGGPLRRELARAWLTAGKSNSGAQPSHYWLFVEAENRAALQKLVCLSPGTWVRQRYRLVGRGSGNYRFRGKQCGDETKGVESHS